MCDDEARFGYYWSACMKEAEQRMGGGRSVVPWQRNGRWEDSDLLSEGIRAADGRCWGKDYAYRGAGCEESPWK